MTLLKLPYFKTRNLVGWIFLLVFLSLGCSSSKLPIIRETVPESAHSLQQSCNNLFPQHSVQFVHTLNVRLPGDSATSVIGITNVNPGESSLESVIMTVEGLVVFHARFTPNKKIVLTSIDPFTSERFSDGLLRDIQLIFQPPDGNLEKLGRTGNNSIICRYRTKKENLVDILLHQDGNWDILLYNSKKQLLRSVAASSIAVDSRDPLTRFPKTMILESSGIFGYSLIMKLLQADYTEAIP